MRVKIRVRVRVRVRARARAKVRVRCWVPKRMPAAFVRISRSSQSAASPV